MAVEEPCRGRLRVRSSAAMTSEEYVKRGGIAGYLSRGNGHGRCCICASMIARGARQYVVQSPNAGARQHLWCLIKAIFKSLLGFGRH